MLRKLEHRLQIMFDLKTHMLPDDREELAKLAVRMGYTGTRHHFAAARRFKTTTRGARGRTARCSIICCTTPFPATARRSRKSIWSTIPIRRRSGFKKCSAAIRSRRAGGVPKPDGAGDREDSLPLDAPLPAFSGGDRPAAARRDRPDAGARYDAREPQPRERFARRQGGAVGAVQLQSAVARTCTSRLCAACPYLAGILTSNPGMIDELMDSLLVEHLPTLDDSRRIARPNCAKGPRTSTRFCTASRTPSTCASACATCWARTTFARRMPRWPISPRRAQANRRARVREAGRQIRLPDDRPAERRRAGERNQPRLSGSGSPVAKATAANRSCSPSASWAAASRTITAISTSSSCSKRAAKRRSRPPRSGERTSGGGGHDQQPLLQRVRPAADPREQSARSVRPAVRSRRPPAADGQERRAGRVVRRASPATSPKARRSFGSGKRCAKRGR